MSADALLLNYFPDTRHPPRGNFGVNGVHFKWIMDQSQSVSVMVSGLEALSTFSQAMAVFHCGAIINPPFQLLSKLRETIDYIIFCPNFKIKAFTAHARGSGFQDT